MAQSKVLQGGVQKNAGATSSTYDDDASQECSENNTSPYAGMNPFTCYGVMAPQDSAGQDGHFVVVDGFAQDAANNWYVIGRDPTNLNLMDATTRQLFEDSGFKNFFVRPLQEFLHNWSGGAVYTTP